MLASLKSLMVSLWYRLPLASLFVDQKAAMSRRTQHGDKVCTLSDSRLSLPALDVSLRFLQKEQRVAQSHQQAQNYDNRATAT